MKSISVLLVSVMMWVVLRSHIFHFQDVAAFGAALDGAVAGHLSGSVVSEMVGLGVGGNKQ